MLCYVMTSLVLWLLTEKMREFNKFAVKRGAREFSDESISLVERMVVDSTFSGAAADVLWQMLQWPPGRSTAVLDRAACSCTLSE